MYGFNIRIDDSFDNTITRVTEALKTEGFGVLTTIDVQATMKARLGLEGRPYSILGACNPPLAHRAIETDPDIGLLLPCNVVVREEEDKSITVSFMDVATVLGIVGNPAISTLGDEVRGKLENVMALLEQGG